MKNFSVKNGFGTAAIIFAVSALVTLPLRTVQFFTVLEGKTGFYTSYDWSVYLLYSLIAASVVAFAALGLSKRKNLVFNRDVVKRPVSGIISLLTAAAVFSDGLIKAGAVMDNGSSFIEYGVMGTTSINMEKLLFGAEALFAVISAIFFLSLGLVYLTGKTNGSEHRLICLSPVIWCIIRMAYRFTRTISYQRVSDLVFELLMLTFMIMFFMAFAQVNSQIGDKNCEWKLAGYGLPAAILALICFVPRFIVTVIGKDALLYEYSSAEFCDLGTALFICSVVFTRLTDKSEKADKAEELTVKG